MGIQNQVDEPQVERVIPLREKGNLTFDIAIAAIFSAVSVGIYATYQAVAPNFWGIKYFDPISFFWLTAFLLYGFRAGLLTTIIGSIIIGPFDMAYPWLGPLMKFFATIWFVVVPYYFMRWQLKREPSATDLTSKDNINLYIKSGIFATLIRIIVMIPLNIATLHYFGIWDFVNLGGFFGADGGIGITGFTAVLIYVSVLNIIHSIFDLTVPFYLVTKTPLKQYQN